MERSCGGSSGGEAALIAAGASPLGLGNDIGGSLRIPAAFCGIASIRPTAGRTPDRCGHGLPIGQQAIVSQVGPMAKRVEDLVMALRIIERAEIHCSNRGPNWATRHRSSLPACASRPSPATANFRLHRRRGARSPKPRRCSLPPGRSGSSGASQH
jgi:Asp-tRNA(Asn)/Glu-tRNA(Gln) amidotransferase A subunit family amidase